MSFLDHTFIFFNTHGPVIGMIFILSLLLIISIYRLDIIMSLFKITKSPFKSDNKTCDIISGKAITINTNILIYLFELHTHYKDNTSKFKNEMYNKQIEFCDQIMDQIIDNSCKKYRKQQEDQLQMIRDSNDCIDSGEVIKEFTLFKDAIRSAFYINVRKKVERSFEKNGFYYLCENDLKAYIGQKTDMIISDITKQLTVYFPIFNYMLIKPDSIVMDEIIDKEYIMKKTTEIYKNAVVLHDEFVDKEEYIKQDFQKSINTLMLQNIFEVS